MTKKESRIWMVRAGSGSFLIDEFLEKNVVAIGWNDLGDLSPSMSYEELKNNYRDIYPEDSDGRTNQSVGQIWRLLTEFNKGDKVVTYDSKTREYYLGEITSSYQYNEDLEYHHSRQVEWYDAPTDRDVLNIESKNRLGSILTIFEISAEIWNDLEQNNPAYLSPKDIEDIEKIQEEYEKDNLEALKNETIAKSYEFIKDIIVKLSWQDVELLVAGVLRTLGYKTRMTSKGSDLGHDIIASPDELALSEPRIKVEVKARSKDKIGADDIRSFIGGLRDFNKGIYVSLSGFSKEAKYESERANFPITLIDLDWLVELLVANYEQLDIETKSLVPLKKIYWPV